MKIWPWSRFRYQSDIIKSLVERNCEFTRELMSLRMELANERSAKNMFKSVYALKCLEIEHLLNATALSPHQRKRRRVKLRRAALLWHEWTEDLIRDELK